MSEIQLTQKDKDRATRINARNQYGVSRTTLYRLGCEHRSGSPYHKAYVEYRLTDINFHSLVGLLHSGQYEQYFADIKNA